eukprot:358811-Chlamydomonas_euryale.AAC.16
MGMCRSHARGCAGHMHGIRSERCGWGQGKQHERVKRLVMCHLIWCQVALISVHRAGLSFVGQAGAGGPWCALASSCGPVMFVALPYPEGEKLSGRKE